MNSRYGSRKFILAAAMLVSATALVWFGKIADGVYSAVVLGVIAAYFTSNVAQKKIAPAEPETPTT